MPSVIELLTSTGTLSSVRVGAVVPAPTRLTLDVGGLLELGQIYRRLRGTPPNPVIATMGDRFVLLRMDSTTERINAGRRAIANTRR